MLLQEQKHYSITISKSVAMLTPGFRMMNSLSSCLNDESRRTESEPAAERMTEEGCVCSPKI